MLLIGWTYEGANMHKNKRFTRQDLEGRWVRHKELSMGIICYADIDEVYGDWITVRFVRDNKIVRLPLSSKSIHLI